MIVLRKIKYGESDLVVHGLDSAGEKRSFIARGAAKSRKRFGGGVLEPTHYIAATYQPSPREQSLHTLQEAAVVNDFPGLKSDYSRVELALYMVGLVDRLSHEGDMDLKNLFDLLGNSLSACERSSRLHVLRTHFEFKLLAYLGILPPWNDTQIFLQTRIDEHEKIDLTQPNAKTFSDRILNFIEEHFQVSVDRI